MRCPKCNGTGHIFIDSLNFKRCDCLLNRLYAKKLGRVLYNVKEIPNTHLLKKLENNMLFITDDEDINPHLKTVFMHLGLNARWLYIEDSNVLQAWLGKPNSAGAENLSDLIEYPFLVLRLGVVGYQNKALPGVICELLMGRILGYKPTWIISPRDLTPETCLEYSDELDNIIRRYFESNRRKTSPKSQPLDTTVSFEMDTPKKGNANATDALRKSNLWRI